ncbi:F-box protein At5g07610-like [Elaeis guineensis]|uniref:F-box protein At5g07610-like n=1 Tax=Elaeis guineensis var. tenera TaxID=51953 RepID=UPI003C6D58E7
MASTPRRLCDDEVSEILSFLPAKSIMKLRTLSRNLLQCSACDHFLLTQSHHTKADSGFFTQPYSGLLNLTPLDPNAGIPGENLHFLRRTQRVVLASANGLLFCSNQSRSLSSLCVYNPVHHIATLRFIPPPTTGEEYHNRLCIAVAVDPMSRDYKLVCLTTTPEWSSFYRCRVYVSADNAWKFDRMVDGGPRNLQLEYPVICDGAVYVASTCGTYMRTDPYVVRFDIEGEGSEILPTPVEAMKTSAYGHEAKIGRWGEKSLCLITCEGSSIFKLWVMSRDQGNITWAEIYRVSVMEVGIASPGEVDAFILINSDTLELEVNQVLDFGYDAFFCSLCSIKPKLANTSGTRSIYKSAAAALTEAMASSQRLL